MNLVSEFRLDYFKREIYANKIGHGVIILFITDQCVYFYFIKNVSDFLIPSIGIVFWGDS